MLNQFVLVGKFIERLQYDENEEVWIIEVEDYDLSYNDKVLYKIKISVTFYKEEFNSLKKGNNVGVKGRIVEDKNGDLKLVGEKISFLKNSMED